MEADGEHMPQTSIYLAFEEERRFVSTNAAVVGDDGDFEPAEPRMIGLWEIEPEGCVARYTAGGGHWTDNRN